jgi:hypothetical protein
MKGLLSILSDAIRGDAAERIVSAIANTDQYALWPAPKRDNSRLPDDNPLRCYYRTNRIDRLIKSGGGKGPVKPRQPAKPRSAPKARNAGAWCQVPRGNPQR